ncbi:hypothetical protein CHCC14809_0632 [Bacillus licheniformis]|uniref:Uncharacterized protein n=2 Tax=Bacillus licheniformis TaxID=1402 RepID=A0A8B5Y628_BACLI|nr:hypothetical protein B4092_2388 [Bacillus licheniformis]KYC75731.1 hypothetical protein B4090_2417 [Bacillus licheniformis]KYC83906.1 hypothetical protein B4091_2485 [Bacillus licheniformis]KYD01547.1 hypothetical protein B4164_2231 [Bacillus licheniformis]OLF86795.1 hypothetical protein B4094_4213 [Bacillus licheniformis]
MNQKVHSGYSKKPQQDVLLLRFSSDVIMPFMYVGTWSHFRFSQPIFYESVRFC